MTEKNSVTQQIQLTPIDFSTVQSPSGQSHLVDRKFKGVLYEDQYVLDGKTSVFKSGELATMLKDEFARKGGINLTNVKIILRGNVANKGFSIAFHSPSEEMKTKTDVDFAINSVSYTINDATKGNRFPVNFTFPTALGMQIVPPDPVYLALHMSVAIDEGFEGTLQIYYTYDCDVIYNKKRSSF